MIRQLAREVVGPALQGAIDRIVNKINTLVDLDFVNFVEVENVDLSPLFDTLITHGLNKASVRWIVVRASAGGVPHTVAYAATDDPKTQIRMRSDGVQRVTLRYF